MAKILVLPSEVIDNEESGNSYAFPADNILMSDNITTVEEAINNKPGEKIDDGGEIFNDYEDNIASRNYSHAEGCGTEASGVGSHAEGQRTISSSQGSHSEGVNTTASAIAAHAEGHSVTASGMYSHAEGFQTTASGDYSHSEGFQTTASGAMSHSEGDTTTASGDYSHAEGMVTIAASEAQHVQGKYNIEDADGVYAHIVGWGTSTSNRANIHTITTTGNGWFAGKVSAGTVGSPATPTAANDLITKKYFDDNVGSGVGEATDDGGEIFNDYSNNEATASNAHAEGTNTTASGSASHAEGSGTTASGSQAHAEGAGTTASGNYSHAEGIGTVASAIYSHAEGSSTTAASQYQHVQGKYNIVDSSGTYAHIVGWGTSTSNRANIHTITTTGNGWFAGKVSAGTTTSPANPTAANDLITKKYFDDNVGSGVGEATDDGGEIFNNYSNNEATASNSHAEGSGTTASGSASHAEGYNSNAGGSYSHAEGSGTTASGSASHAEGYYTSAGGNYSHAEGYYTTASSQYQHVQGKYNIVDSSGTYAHIVGWGTSTSNRANIHTITTTGNGWFAGTVEGENGLKVGDALITYDDNTQMIVFDFN